MSISFISTMPFGSFSKKHPGANFCPSIYLWSEFHSKPHWLINSFQSSNELINTAVSPSESRFKSICSHAKSKCFGILKTKGHINLEPENVKSLKVGNINSDHLFHLFFKTERQFYGTMLNWSVSTYWQHRTRILQAIFLQRSPTGSSVEKTQDYILFPVEIWIKFLDLEEKNFPKLNTTHTTARSVRAKNYAFLKCIIIKLCF